jgi:hypothetical protein
MVEVMLRHVVEEVVMVVMPIVVTMVEEMVMVVMATVVLAMYRLVVVTTVMPPAWLISMLDLPSFDALNIFWLLDIA